MYPDFVTCEDQPAHRTVLSAPLFLEQNIKHYVGPGLCQNCLLNKFVTASFFFGGGGGGGHVFEIKEADYQTTCCCCFKTRVARGALAHESGLSTQNIIA